MRYTSAVARDTIRHRERRVVLSLIVGGAASGKSAYAEALVRSIEGRRVYVATMEPWDEECRERIARHRAQRAGHGFVTIERYRDLGGLKVPADANVLIDCLGNLIANELYPLDAPSPDATDVAKSVVEGVRTLCASCTHLTLVANEVCAAGTAYEGDTLAYLRAIGHINCAIAAEADFVCEVVAGLPNVLKGKPPTSNA